MSVNYASGLSPYEHKGVVGQPETFDPEGAVEEKVRQLCDWVKESSHLVVHTGAGISTSAGIPDFRGPNGVWTLEKRGESPELSVTFDEAQPTLTHRALIALEKAGYVKYIISQNIDGLHLRSGFPRNKLSELHGNMFVEECDKCHTQFVSKNCVPTIGLKYTGSLCQKANSKGILCRGRLKDTVLDWEDNLPDWDLTSADQNVKQSDLSLCLGTSLQIVPSGNLPLVTVKNKGKLAIVNLQPTKHDKRCHLKINTYVDTVMAKLCENLGVAIEDYAGPHYVLKSEHPVQPIKGMKFDVRLKQEEGDLKTNGTKSEKSPDEKKDVLKPLPKSSQVNNTVKSESLKCEGKDVKQGSTLRKPSETCLKEEHLPSNFNKDSLLSVSTLKNSSKTSPNVQRDNVPNDTSSSSNLNSSVSAVEETVLGDPSSLSSSVTAVEETVLSDPSSLSSSVTAVEETVLSDSSSQLTSSDSATHPVTNSPSSSVSSSLQPVPGSGKRSPCELRPSDNFHDFTSVSDQPVTNMDQSGEPVCKLLKTQ